MVEGLVIAAALLVLLGSPASAAELAGASFSAPPGWSVETDTAAAEPSVRMTRAQHVLRVRLLGGAGSRYAQARDFLQGFEAKTLGAPPADLGEAPVSGARARLYRRGYPIDLGDPHAPASRAPRLAYEEFCVVPAGKRFFVLSYAYEDPFPDPGDAAKKVWRPFLKSFKLSAKR